MRRSIRAWLGETHSLRFEMVRHFAASFFDSEMFTVQGQWTKVVIGVVSGLVPLALLMAPAFLRRYGCVNASHPSSGCPAIPDYRGFYSDLVRSDMAWIIGLAMCATALAVAPVWQALFPSRRDRLALASLPVDAKDIFAAKFTAAVCLFAVFALAMTVVPSALFAAVIRGPWQENPSLVVNITAALASTLTASAFVFFALVAFQGILLNILPVRLFSRIMPYVQASIVALALAALPFLWPEPGAPAWRPVTWFLGLWADVIQAPGASGRAAPLAVGLAAALALLSYTVSCARYERWLLESPVSATRRSSIAADFGSRLLDRWIRDAREQAMFSFIAKTLARSSTHRRALMLVAGLGVVSIAKCVGDHSSSPRAEVSGFAFATAFLPITGAVFGLLALRLFYALPADLHANWIFRLTEAEGRAAWLLAMERFAVCCVLLPIYVCGAFPALFALGAFRGARVCLLGFSVALIVFEVVFRNWRKAPFTCSYQPGKRPIWLIITAGLLVLAWIAPVSLLVLVLSRNPVAFAGSLPVILAIWWKLRKDRQVRNDVPLIYEDLPEAVACPLNIEYEPGLHADDLAAAPSCTATRVRNFSNSPDESQDRRIAPFFALDGIGGDFRYALRSIRKRLPLSLTVVATLTVGIGVNVSIFALIHGTMLRARVPNPETFIGVSLVGEGRAGVTAAEYRSFREDSRTLADLAAWRVAAVTLGRDHSRRRRVLLASCNFFSLRELNRPVLGRLFRSGDCESGGERVVVLSELAWRRQFDADPGMVGRTILINDRAFTVAGVAPSGHSARIQGAEAWLPYQSAPVIEPGSDYSKGWLTLEGRLAPGSSRVAAQAELQSFASRLQRWGSKGRVTLTVSDGSWISISNSNRAYARWLLVAVLGALGMVLLIVCINVTTLLLSRAVARRREIGVRLSLGAPRARLARMLFIETFLLTAAAGATGLCIAQFVPRALYVFLMNETPDFSLAPDWRIVSYIVGLVFLAASASGLSPAIESLRVDLASALNGYENSARRPGGFRMQNLLVSLQVAMSLLLLVAAGFCGRILLQMRLTTPGVETRQVLAIKLHFPQGSRKTSALILRTFVDRIRQLPGVKHVAFAGSTPFDGQSANAMAPVSGLQLPLSLHSVSPEYFETLGISILRGRAFRESDPEAGGLGAQAVISENVARALWPGQEAIGRRVAMGTGPALDVIGVSRDVKDPMSPLPSASAYVIGEMSGGSYLYVRCSGNPQTIGKSVQAAIRQVNPDFIVTPTPLQTLLDEPLSVLLRFASVVWIVGLIACLLAMAGIYGVVSFNISRRTKETGIRAALGAQRRDILREILLSAGRPVVLGILSGLWLSLAANPLIGRFLSEAPPSSDSANALVYFGAALLLALAAGVAVLISAQRGIRLDPSEAVRQQ